MLFILFWIFCVIRKTVLFIRKKLFQIWVSYLLVITVQMILYSNKVEHSTPSLDDVLHKIYPKLNCELILPNIISKELKIRLHSWFWKIAFIRDDWPDPYENSFQWKELNQYKSCIPFEL